MKKLQVYVLKEFFPPFLLSLGLFTFIMLLDKLLDLLDMIVSKGVPMRIVAEIFLLLLPSMVAVVIPMGVLAGILIAVGRLSGDLEITAMKACGASIYNIMFPLGIVALLIAGVLVVFNNSILPEANHIARNLLLDIGTMRPTARIEPGMFVDEIENYRIFVQEKDDLTGKLIGVIIHTNTPGAPARTITAMEGTMEPVGANHLRLTLEDGQMHEKDRESGYRYASFSTYIIDIARSEELVRHDRSSRGDREMSAEQMGAFVDSLDERRALLIDSISTIAGTFMVSVYNEDNPVAAGDSTRRIRNTMTWLTGTSTDLILLNEQINNLQKNIGKYNVEIHKKYSIPFACIVFVLLGVPLGLSSKNSNTGLAVSMSLVFILVYYFFLIAGEQLADRGRVAAWIAMWSPNILLGILGVYLTYRSMREGHPIPLPDFKELIQKFRRRGHRR
ncbi:MAG: LptF/LptG family permease [Candidatus Sabulitectum sp.]|nr:LptF/LptG family permease [Candidatus Sabulitectum sp.]